MKRKNILTLIALVMVFVLSLTACGADKADETIGETVPALDASQTLELTSFTLSSSTWSSPNGATIHLNAVPNGYAEGQSAAFIVRLEGEEVENIACDWDGSQYTAAAELNAADGYCYYVLLTAADGTQTEVAVNTPTDPTDETLINLESSLNSYCNLTVEASEQNGSKLVITEGSVEVQVPRITNAGESITVNAAVLVLTYNDSELAAADVTLSASEVPGAFEADISGISFDIPAMEDDQQLAVRLDVTLSNNQTLTATGCTWSFMGGNLISAVG